jgi:hypothetical protein
MPQKYNLAPRSDEQQQTPVAPGGYALQAAPQSKPQQAATQGAPPSDPRSLVNQKVDRFVEALVGAPLPNERSSEYMRRHLAPALGVNFDDIASRAQAFDKMPGIEKFFAKKIAAHEIGSKADAYADDALTTRIPRARQALDQNEQAMLGFNQDAGYKALWQQNVPYARKMLDSLEEVLRDKEMRKRAAQAVLDFHGLSDAPSVPFVHSNITYPQE